jgi:hypothetical protein
MVTGRQPLGAAGLVATLLAFLAGAVALIAAAQTSTPPSAPMKNLAHLTNFNVIELRRYPIKDGERDNFARYFESYFPEAFQQQGAIIFGQFLEQEKADTFTWIRGFHTTDDRAKVNATFYYGPLWQEHKATMNSRLIDHTNVLLLKPLRPERGVNVMPAVDPVKEAAGAKGFVVMQIFAAQADKLDALVATAEKTFAQYREAGIREAGVLVTLDGPNNFPQLPFRTDGPYLVWLGVAKDKQSVERFTTIAREQSRVFAKPMLRSPPEIATMRPTQRSRLRWLEE